MWQAKRCDYSKEFRTLLKDVLLTRIGKDIVGGMVKEARAKIEPKEETQIMSHENMLLDMQNKHGLLQNKYGLLEQENESRKQENESQKQEIERLTALLQVSMKPSVNLSDFNLSDVGMPDLTWICANGSVG